MRFPSGYNNNLALTLANLAEAAYAQLSDFKSRTGKAWKPPTGFTLRATMTAVYETGNPPLGFIASKGKQLYVSWRGTDDAMEWIEDAKFDLTPCSYLPGGEMVELGFHELYTTGSLAIRSPQETVMTFIRANEGKYSTLYVTGHSLGAALAVLNAGEIAYSTSFKPIMYTFAGPRVGSPKFDKTFKGMMQTSWRVVNTNDAVPKVPISSMGFKHVNKEVPITFGGGWPWDWGQDHSLLNYIKQLKALRSA